MVKLSIASWGAVAAAANIAFAAPAASAAGDALVKPDQTADSAKLGPRPRLSAELHRQLLLTGRPQIGLYKALTEQLAQQAVGGTQRGADG